MKKQAILNTAGVTLFIASVMVCLPITKAQAKYNPIKWTEKSRKMISDCDEAKVEKVCRYSEDMDSKFCDVELIVKKSGAADFLDKKMLVYPKTSTQKNGTVVVAEFEATKFPYSPLEGKNLLYSTEDILTDNDYGSAGGSIYYLSLKQDRIVFSVYEGFQVNGSRVLSQRDFPTGTYTFKGCK